MNAYIVVTDNGTDDLPRLKLDENENRDSPLDSVILIRHNTNSINTRNDLDDILILSDDEKIEESGSSNDDPFETTSGVKVKEEKLSIFEELYRYRTDVGYISLDERDSHEESINPSVIRSPTFIGVANIGAVLPLSTERASYSGRQYIRLLDEGDHPEESIDALNERHSYEESNDSSVVGSSTLTGVLHPFSTEIISRSGHQYVHLRDEVDHSEESMNASMVENRSVTGVVLPFSTERMARSGHQFVRTFIAPPGKLLLIIGTFTNKIICCNYLLSIIIFNILYN